MQAILFQQTAALGLCPRHSIFLSNWLRFQQWLRPCFRAAWLSQQLFCRYTCPDISPPCCLFQTDWHFLSLSAPAPAAMEIFLLSKCKSSRRNGVFPAASRIQGSSVLRLRQPFACL